MAQAVGRGPSALPWAGVATEELTAVQSVLLEAFSHRVQEFWEQALAG